MSNSKKYKILIVHNYYQISGGEDTVVANEKKMLEGYGHEVVLYSRSNSELKEMNTAQKLFLPITTVFNLKSYKEIKKIIREQQVDIIHVHNTFPLISPAVYYAALRCKVPVVQTIHNFRLLCPGATFYRDGHICEDCVEKGLKCAIKHGCYRDSKPQTLACVVSTKIHRMTGVYGKINYICLTEFNKKKLLSLKQIKQEYVFVKPNFAYSNPLMHRRGEYYLFIGRVERIKGIELIIDAFRRMPEKRLIIAGTGTQLKNCRELLKENSIDNIQLVGFQKKMEINSLLSAAVALIVASQWYEGFAMIIIEAFSSGVPVITGDVGNIGNLVDECSTGVHFTYNSADSLINAVKRFETVRGIDWERNVLNEYYNKYSPERNYKILSAVYEKAENRLQSEVIWKV